MRVTRAQARRARRARRTARRSLDVWIVQDDRRRRRVLGITKLRDLFLEPSNLLSESLCTCFAFAIVVLAAIRFMSANTLRARWLSAIASLI